jgi:hypothetical protein
LLHLIESQTVLHRFEALMRAGYASQPSAPCGTDPSSVRVPARASDVTTISRAAHNCPEVLQEDRLGCYSQYY